MWLGQPSAKQGGRIKDLFFHFNVQVFKNRHRLQGLGYNSLDSIFRVLRSRFRFKAKLRFPTVYKGAHQGRLMPPQGATYLAELGLSGELLETFVDYVGVSPK